MARYHSWKNGDLHYVKRGLGDPLLLVHGIYPGASLDEFERNIDALAHHRTVYAIDLLGFGESSAPRMKFTARTMVAQIFDFLRDEIGRPTDVVASGLSCSYVSEVAAWRTNLIQRLVFICPRSEPVGLNVPRWVAPISHFMISAPGLGDGYYETMSSEVELRSFLLGCFHNPRNVTQELVERLRENAVKPGSNYPYASLVTGYLDMPLLNSLPKVTCPILVLWGRHAKPSPVEHSVRLIALAQNARLEVLEEGGAWAHVEQSRLANQYIADFLEGTPATRAAETA